MKNVITITLTREQAAMLVECVINSLIRGLVDDQDISDLSDVVTRIKDKAKGEPE
jgi:hypothetical protein